jgi:glutamate--cysteine ligase
MSADLHDARLRDRIEAEAYVASVCFKHGPPALIGTELEWTVHHAADPRRPLDVATLRTALGVYAPPTLTRGSPHRRLPSGSPITVEPGGQVEISALPRHSLAELITSVYADLAFLSDLLREHGLALGDAGTDPYREPVRLLDTPRYAAMERAFTPIGRDGITMMCTTAGLQVCLDVGEGDQVAARWSAATALGPVLLAAFANSPDLRGSPTGWASARMRAVLGTDPPRSRPDPVSDDPAAHWARRVMDTPLVCVRSEDECWDAPPGITFADWVDGALPTPPTKGDLDYHLSTMFTPVRPQGYLEIRYLDAQPGRHWVTPVALLTALMSTPDTVHAALALAMPVADLWEQAAHHGLAEPRLARVAASVIELGVTALPATGLPVHLIDTVTDDLDAVLRAARRS